MNFHREIARGFGLILVLDINLAPREAKPHLPKITESGENGISRKRLVFETWSADLDTSTSVRQRRTSTPWNENGEKLGSVTVRDCCGFESEFIFDTLMLW